MFIPLVKFINTLISVILKNKIDTGIKLIIRFSNIANGNINYKI